ARRGVRLPSARTPNAGPPVVGFSFDTKKAVEALTAMKPAEREAVLNDVLDGIVGAIGTGTAAPAATVGTMTTDAPVYVLIHPDGRAEWGDRIAVAEKALGPHGIGRAFLTDGSRLRIAMSDCALVLRDEYEPNPYAAVALAHVAGVRPEDAPETRGPVALFGYDPLNEWDNTRPLTADERALITRALTAAGCTTAPPTRP
ncbi:hypothetical protein, partial [Streptomyces sp. CoH27]|uniref:hypothetical protein n=1 Tax=Streptomyces sp. CoH27 TaxID=2875763 RepID=UPI001CD7348B